jgi:hypothetical protein
MSSSTKHFIRHYVEMVVAMFAGMAVLGMPFGWLLGAADSSWQELTDTAPALMFLAMATTMTVPMIGWMAYRGHGRRAPGAAVPVDSPLAPRRRDRRRASRRRPRRRFSPSSPARNPAGRESPAARSHHLEAATHAA